MKQRKLLIVLSSCPCWLLWSAAGHWAVGSDKKMGGCTVACHDDDDDDDDDEGRHQEPGAVRLCDISPSLSCHFYNYRQRGSPPTSHLQEYDYSTVSYCPYGGSGVGPTLVLSHLCYADFIIYFVCHTLSHHCSRCDEGREVTPCVYKEEDDPR